MRYFFILLIYLVGLFFVPKACLAIGVIINEVAWAGSSESANDEWLELYNPASAKVDLSGWSLVAGDGSPAILLVGSIEGEAYYLLERTDDDSAVGVCADQIYSGSLSNSGEALVLIDNNDVVIDSLDCHDDWLAGDSSTRLGMQKINNLWVDNCSSEGSPRRDNVVCEESFDDEDVVELVEVEEVETNETLAEAVDLASEGISNLETINSPVAGKIVKKVELPPVIISEIMPNPLGVDSEEWIELYNRSQLRVDISAWILRDEQGEYKIADNTYLKSGGYLLLKRQETNLALNNNGDKLFLIRAADGEAISSLSFQAAVEATSLIWDKASGQYLWTTYLSPGAENILEIPNRVPLVDFYLPEKIKTGELIVLDGSDSWDADDDVLAYLWQLGDAEKIRGVLVSHAFYIPGKYNIKLEVSDGEYQASLSKQIVVSGKAIIIDSFDAGNAKLKIIKGELGEIATKPDKLTISKIIKTESPASVCNLVSSKTSVSNNNLVKGVVTALPGSLGSQYFYITGVEQAYQVYNYKKDFPELALGDLVEIYGEKSLINNETRVKTKVSSDMRIVSRENELLCQEIKSGEECDDLLGSLVSFKGEVVKKSGSDIYFDDGVGEFRVYLKQASGIKSSVFSMGDMMEIVGIFSKSKSGYQILPRTIEDLVFLNNDNYGEISGEYTSSSNWKLTQRNNNRVYVKYLLVSLFSVLIICSIIFFKKKENRQV